MTVGIIGIDKRRNGIADGFIADGCEVFSYGTDTDMDERAFSADVVVLPFPVCTGSQLNAPLCEKNINVGSVAESISDNSIVFGGLMPVWMKNDFTKRRMKFFDISEYEPYTLKNAFYTAEGAIMCAIANTDYSLNGARCAVLGYGRIASMLAKLLRAFGAEVFVYARRAQARAQAWADGIRADCFCGLDGNFGSFDLVFNTVPSLIVDSELIEAASENLLIIDLASKPGGVDFEAAKAKGIKVLWELGIPGRVSHESAGYAVYEAISEILAEMEVR